MADVVLTCSRCGKTIEGFEDSEGCCTSGFYRVDAESYWHRYARPFEVVLCDECMWNDKGYRRDYDVKERELQSIFGARTH